MTSQSAIPTIDGIENFDFPKTVRRLKEKREAFCGGMRPLRDAEIERLEAGGNRAQDWRALRVSGGFSADHISNSRFFGACFLGSFDGSLTDAGTSLRLPSGIHDSIIIDSAVGDGCCVWNVKGLSNYFVDERAILCNAGTISCSPSATFGNGREIVVGIETGGREVLSFADMTIAIAEEVAMQRETLKAFRRFIDAYLERIRTGFGIIETTGSIVNCPRIIDTFIGAGARCENATLIENATILSITEEPTRVDNGAYVRNSCIQWGTYVSSMGIVDDSVLTEHSHVERHGKVTHSIIGPNTGVAEGEVTASLVGPFVGFHHQALLIGALWPQGKGNIAFGANVGSNHTSKAPDQEIYCGEGLFFGLGVNIKFPANYFRAPYSIIATGVTTLPQRVTFPFSLINVPSRRFDDVPPAYNELFPGWVLSDNLYTVARNEGKYVKRNKARRSEFSFEVFRPEIIDLMAAARERLRNAATKEYYTDADIPGIGKNFMTGQSLLKGIDAYLQHIERYCLSGLFRRCKQLRDTDTTIDYRSILTTPSDDPRWEHERSLLVAEGFDQRPLRENLERLAELAGLAARAIAIAKEKDDIRGRAVMEDYDSVHIPATEDGFVRETAGNNEATRKEITAFIASIDH
ncbi:MAG: DUF4954 family protein [Chitinispirillaceae bacterium]|nr:DUF4954 family protein [Chitinispirillaceae bacterium]